MKFISPAIHGIIDILVVIFLLASPTLFGFTELVVRFTYALATVHLLLTLLTRYDIGIFKVIPLPAHGSIELIVGIALIILAYTWFRHDVTGKLYYILFGTIVLLTWFCTDYSEIGAKS
jgi:hypothetical protein